MRHPGNARALNMSDQKIGESTLPRTLTGFLGRQVRARPFGFIGFFALVISAAGTAVAVQYGMKLLVDAMSGGKAGHHNAYWALLFFLVLIGVESALWRASGVIGSRTIIAAGVKIRLDLFRHLAGHSMRYFNENFSGSLGHRITATAGHFGSLISTCAWNITPPLIDFLGALIIFASIRPPMAAALAGPWPWSRAASTCSAAPAASSTAALLSPRTEPVVSWWMHSLSGSCTARAISPLRAPA
jgi:ATP-binding cassette subfamily B protein